QRRGAVLLGMVARGLLQRGGLRLAHGRCGAERHTPHGLRQPVPCDRGGRRVTKALNYIEIDVDYCSLTYSVPPCMAALGVTGDVKCFNSLGTCQDPDNFANEPVTLRFTMPADYLPRDIEAF